MKWTGEDIFTYPAGVTDNAAATVSAQIMECAHNMIFAPDNNSALVANIKSYICPWF